MPQNTVDLIPGGGPNQPGGLAQITSGGFYSTSTTGYAVQPAYSFSDDSLGFYQSRASTVALSYGTLDLFTNTNAISMRTYADAPSGQSIGQWGFIQNASGFSVFYSSGKSIYYFGGSTLSAAQP